MSPESAGNPTAVPSATSERSDPERQSPEALLQPIQDAANTGEANELKGDRRAEGPDDVVQALVTEFLTLGTNLANLFVQAREVDVILRWRRADPQTLAGKLLTGFATAAPLLIIPLVLTAVFDQWQDVPVWRWAIVALWVSAGWVWVAPALMEPFTESFALMRTMTDPEDCRRALAWTRRWIRLRLAIAAGLAFTVFAVLAIYLMSPDVGLDGLPIGTTAVLVMYLYVTGEFFYSDLLITAAGLLEGRFAHRLFWPSPLDSTAMRTHRRALAKNEFRRGLSVTGDIIVMVILLGLHSPVTIPVVVVLLAAGYLAILVSAVAWRRATYNIVEQARGARMTELEEQINVFGPRLSHLTAEQCAELDSLTSLHRLVRESPSQAGAGQALAHVIGSLVIPTVTVLATVIGERYAGQLLEKVLP